MMTRRCDKISETQYKFIFIFFILLAIFKNLSHFKVKSRQTLRWRRLSTWQTCDKLVTNDKKMWQMVFLSVGLTKYFYKFVTNFVTWDKNVTNWGQNLSYDFLMFYSFCLHREDKLKLVILFRWFVYIGKMS